MWGVGGISNSLLRRVWSYEIQSGSGAAQVRRAQRVLPEVCYALPAAAALTPRCRRDRCAGDAKAAMHMLLEGN